jgi:hypothetical protein
MTTPLAQLPEVTVRTFRSALLWAWHGRQVTLVCADEATAKRAASLLADRLGPRAGLVRVELRGVR